MPDERDPRPSAEALLGRAGEAIGWLARTGWRVTRALPGGELVEEQARRWERAAVREIRRRLEPADTTPGFAWRPFGSSALDPKVDRTAIGDHELVTLVRPMNGHAEPLRAGMAELLNRSANSNAQASREFLYTAILRQLVPDEARIIAALADGAPRPLIHVAVRTAIGATSHTVLANASTVGKNAGVASPELVPTYVTRLYQLGLADIGEEDPDLGDQYDILLTDPTVRAAAAEAKRPRFLRHTVRISALGRMFWAECDRPSAVSDARSHRDVTDFTDQ
ncbi:MAG TPA: Abi-alpha family protein [Pseudonocardiaceae bacterium]|nr:Abi-alpha family protein [Pseudonocardiaceae bacterium]